MTPYERLSALLDDPGNRHGPDRACAAVGTAGGRTRYVWIERHGDYGGARLTVILFGNRIARLFRSGTVAVSTAGYFTPTTRDALAFVVSGYLNGNVTMRLPGSRGGPDTAPDSCLLHVGGQTYTLTDTGHPAEWATIPAEAFA